MRVVRSEISETLSVFKALLAADALTGAVEQAASIRIAVNRAGQKDPLHRERWQRRRRTASRRERGVHAAALPRPAQRHNPCFTTRNPPHAFLRPAEAPMSNLRQNVFGIEVDCIDQAALIIQVLNRVRLGTPGYVVPTNLYHIVKLRSDDGNLRSALADAAFVVPDGRPLLWMGRLRGIAFRLVTGSDLLIPLCHAAAQAKRSVFFFGATFETLAECGRRISASIDGLQIAGVYAPPFGFERDANEQLLADYIIRAAAPDIVFVALGVPKQEIWARDNAAKLNVEAICVGASFDFIAGTQRRAPANIRRMGFEWLWRVLTEPRRLAMRYAAILCWLPVLVGSDLIATWQARRQRAR
jgi:N-acetylglucosaminyldiphosphoundecaprenol N-acetyl-beta-D-mannosaminyltransferase